MAHPAPGETPDPPARPGRIFRGWWVAGAAFAATFGSVAFFNPVLGVFVQLLEEDFGWQRSQVALALITGGLLGGLVAPVAGSAIDRWGGRWVIFGAACGMAVMALVLSQMQALWHLLLFFAIGRALAVSVMTPSGFVAVANWFVRRRAMVAGFVAIGPRLGMAAMPLVVAVVIGMTGSWRAGWVALALIVFLSGIPALLLIRRRPEDVGLRPDGDAVPAPGQPREPEPLDRDFELREALRTRAYWLVGFMIACVQFAGGAINFHQIPHLIDQGLTRTEAASIITVFSIAGAAGAVIGGSIATRITMRWTMVISLIGMSLALLLLLNATSVPTAVAFALTYGLFFGSQVSLDQVVHADYFGRRSIGVIRGSFQPAALGMNAFGPFLAGLWYDQAGSYTGAFLLFSVLFLLAALLIAFASYPRRPRLEAGR